MCVDDGMGWDRMMVLLGVVRWWDGMGLGTVMWLDAMVIMW